MAKEDVTTTAAAKGGTTVNCCDGRSRKESSGLGRDKRSHSSGDCSNGCRADQRSRKSGSGWRCRQLLQRSGRFCVECTAIAH